MEARGQPFVVEDETAFTRLGMLLYSGSKMVVMRNVELCQILLRVGEQKILLLFRFSQVLVSKTIVITIRIPLSEIGKFVRMLSKALGKSYIQLLIVLNDFWLVAVCRPTKIFSKILKRLFSVAEYLISQYLVRLIETAIEFALVSPLHSLRSSCRDFIIFAYLMVSKLYHRYIQTPLVQLYTKILQNFVRAAEFLSLTAQNIRHNLWILNKCLTKLLIIQPIQGVVRASTALCNTISDHFLAVYQSLASPIIYRIQRLLFIAGSISAKTIFILQSSVNLLISLLKDVIWFADGLIINFWKKFLYRVMQMLTQGILTAQSACCLLFQVQQYITAYAIKPVLKCIIQVLERVLIILEVLESLGFDFFLAACRGSSIFFALGSHYLLLPIGRIMIEFMKNIGLGIVWLRKPIHFGLEKIIFFLFKLFFVFKNSFTDILRECNKVLVMGVHTVLDTINCCVVVPCMNSTSFLIDEIIRILPISLKYFIKVLKKWLVSGMFVFRSAMRNAISFLLLALRLFLRYTNKLVVIPIMKVCIQALERLLIIIESSESLGIDFFLLFLKITSKRIISPLWRFSKQIINKGKFWLWWIANKSFALLLDFEFAVLDFFVSILSECFIFLVKGVNEIIQRINKRIVIPWLSFVYSLGNEILERIPRSIKWILSVIYHIILFIDRMIVRGFSCLGGFCIFTIEWFLSILEALDCLLIDILLFINNTTRQFLMLIVKHAIFPLARILEEISLFIARGIIWFQYPVGLVFEKLVDLLLKVSFTAGKVFRRFLREFTKFLAECVHAILDSVNRNFIVPCMRCVGLITDTIICYVKEFPFWFLSLLKIAFEKALEFIVFCSCNLIQIMTNVYEPLSKCCKNIERKIETGSKFVCGIGFSLVLAIRNRSHRIGNFINKAYQAVVLPTAMPLARISRNIGNRISGICSFFASYGVRILSYMYMKSHWVIYNSSHSAVNIVKATIRTIRIPYVFVTRKASHYFIQPIRNFSFICKLEETIYWILYGDQRCFRQGDFGIDIRPSAFLQESESATFALIPNQKYEIYIHNFSKETVNCTISLGEQTVPGTFQLKSNSSHSVRKFVHESTTFVYNNPVNINITFLPLGEPSRPTTIKTQLIKALQFN